MSSGRSLERSLRLRTWLLFRIALTLTSGALACSKEVSSGAELASVSTPPVAPGLGAPASEGLSATRSTTSDERDASRSPTPSAPPREDAAELAARADAQLAELGPNDTAALLALLESPNRYLRGGALDRLRDRAPALSRDSETLERVVELLNDPAPLASDHARSVGERAREVLLRVQPEPLAAASVRAFARTPYLAEPLDGLVRDRAAELARPLQQALVRADRAGRLGEVDAALRLLAQLDLGAGDPEAIHVLHRLAKDRRPLHALRAKVRLLTLTHDPSSKKLPRWAEDTYAELGTLLARDPKRPCTLDSGCIPTENALVELQPLREAASPLVPELVRLLDTDDEWLRGSSLGVLEKLGERARPAVPKIVALLTRPRAQDGHGNLGILLKVLAAARLRSASVKRALVTTTRQHPASFDGTAAVLAQLGYRLSASERALFRGAYQEHCAGSATSSAGSDERCGHAQADLKKLGVHVTAP